MLELAIILTILGLTVKFGKLHKWLILYRLLSPKEKETIDTDKLESIFLAVMLGMSFALIICHLSQNLFTEKSFQTISIITISITGVITLMACKPLFQKNN
ncbi:MAG: DUF3784 domain-containing protein [Rhodobacteraceae bacterium]|nr:DUF3784 domain-containing protein [Paracoccaceae bacterium]